MFTQGWKTSERKYDVIVERDVRIPVRDGTLLAGDLFRPAGPGKFPVILGCHPYNCEVQTAPLRPIGYGNLRGYIEAGDPAFLVRRGYVQAVVNVRGSGKSQGKFQMMGPLEVQDVCDTIQWLANQPWSDRNVGMFGVSYFAWLQLQVGALNPPHLKAIFAPWGATDFYRDVFYHGGILAHGFLRHWSLNWDNPRPMSWCREKMGDEQYRRAIEAALRDEDIVAVADLRQALENPDKGRSPAVVDVILNALDGDYYQESLDRPVYQYQYESLRWFDYWLKGIDTGVMDDPPVRLFMSPAAQWKSAKDWPLPETRWTPFYLHAGGLLSEHELWPDEGCDRFEDSTFAHHELTYWTPSLVENTELIGPVVLDLFASSSDAEMFVFATLLLQDRDGQVHELTRGWLRGSQRALRADSEPWDPILAHDKREPLEPGKIYELRFAMVPTARLVLAGERIGVRIKGADNEAADSRLQQIARGCLWRQSPWRMTVYHEESHPSHLLLPITQGNLVGTFLSGGELPDIEPGEKPYAKFHMPKE
ncbi:MAG: CocE/NonD family hydrolase [Deltaproteobacteria bacterium]|nr:CocE/NonD family hydrolase [Deltaproteobacteria bacterium]